MSSELDKKYSEIFVEALTEIRNARSSIARQINTAVIKLRQCVAVLPWNLKSMKHKNNVKPFFYLLKIKINE